MMRPKIWKLLLCAALLGVGLVQQDSRPQRKIAFDRQPAAEATLRDFYRAIRALTGSSFLNGTALALT